MPYCMNCGAKLSTEDTFCGACGEATSFVDATKGGAPGLDENLESEQTIPKSVQLKSEKPEHCPACGEVVPKSAYACPVCGYELRSSAEGSIAQLYRKLEEIENLRTAKGVLRKDESSTDEKKANAIRNFPIPNTKEDLIEFLVMAKSNSSSSDFDSSNDVILNAWRSKFDQAYDKAKCLYGEDDGFGKLQALKDQADEEANSRLRRTRGTFIALFALCFACAALSMFFTYFMKS